MANYFIYGDDEFLVGEKVRELLAQNAQSDIWAVEKIETWPDLQEKLFDLGMFSERRVFQASYDILTGVSGENLQAVLGQHANVLILYSNKKPDKRSSTFKTVSALAKVYELNGLKGSDLAGWLVRRAAELGAEKLEHRTAELLIYMAGSNMLLLDNELKKLISYSPIITEDSVAKLAVRDLQVSVFTLIDWVVQGDAAKALAAVGDMIQAGAAVPYILHMLARQYRMLFRVLFYRQKGYGNGDIQKMMPMHPYAFQKLAKQSSGISQRECAKSLALILQADYAFKTGRSQGAALLQVLTLKLAKK